MLIPALRCCWTPATLGIAPQKVHVPHRDLPLSFSTLSRKKKKSVYSKDLAPPLFFSEGLMLKC